MADANLVKAVKLARGMTGTFEPQDGQLNIEIDTVIGLMVDGGISQEVANSEASAGVIARGIEDIKYNGGKLSEFFWQRAIQLVYKTPTTEEVTGDV